MRSHSFSALQGLCAGRVKQDLGFNDLFFYDDLLVLPWTQQLPLSSKSPKKILGTPPVCPFSDLSWSVALKKNAKKRNTSTLFKCLLRDYLTLFHLIPAWCCRCTNALVWCVLFSQKSGQTYGNTLSMRKTVMLSNVLFKYKKKNIFQKLNKFPSHYE